MRIFNAESTTHEVIEGISLAGKFAVVTGASSGLGVETVRTLAGAGSRVLMLARDQVKLEGVAEALRSADGKAQLDIEIVDLSDLDSVRRGLKCNLAPTMWATSCLPPCWPLHPEAMVV